MHVSDMVQAKERRARRDKFAMLAMTAIMDRPHFAPDDLARAAVAAADAMLAALDKPEGGQ